MRITCFYNLNISKNSFESPLYIIYADFESLTTKIQFVSPNPSKSSTEKFPKHQACGFAYVIVSEKPEYCNPPVLYRGEDAVDKFLEALQQEEDEFILS